MWIHNLNPTLLSLGPLEIRWYGLVYVLGFFFAIYWLRHLSKKGRLSLNKEEVWDLGFYLMLGVIIGSRLFEIFWEPQHYLSNPLNLLKVWKGGMSFHGGLVGIVAAAWIYCKKKKINFWKIADILSLPAMLALALGRIANFVNGELVGRVWNGRWCVVFPDYNQLCRHPSTLYAAGKRFLIFGWLLFLSFRKEFKPGFIFWNFVFWEGLGRIIVDFFRQDQLFFYFTLGQWFSLVMVILALFMFIKHYPLEWKKIFK
ncbi:MAG: prolipoprotein diacylglyceryl transferase [Nanoarchaeota archaeon]|nr:prolipoprotein diacylglyceryl transferase [Nanoarchaeota archaeon]MBU1643603.1 prolipoprotein diacylglyceryl transferase [Nanoarchaeota archaeon]MBU1976618.1 prolipoprotein diacylglyceryl transferase [Nanoarchaeota archaeon]